ncbi:MAG: M18 family aminopeptidase [Myxococcota bacterium]
MSDVLRDLRRFLDASPTPYHAVGEAARRLDDAGFSRTDEREPWSLERGERGYSIRGGSLVAFQVGGRSPAEAGFRIVGAHTDSPNFRLRPLSDESREGYRQLGVEPYGGVLLHTWLDRDLSIAGRVSLASAEGLRSVLVDFEQPLVRIPSLAIHLSREVNKEGLKLNPQQHLVPVSGLADAPPLRELLAAELARRRTADVAAGDILAWDLMLYDVQPACIAGARGEFLLGARLDNLVSCHAALCALVAAGEAPGTPGFTRVVALYDHEEVGSRSASGAAGPVLAEALERIVTGFKGGAPQALARALSRSTLISSDMAHAVHPNYADRHEASHRPILGRGPVIKTHASQAYATDSDTAGLFAAICARVDVTPQHFVSRSDLPCGSTIGPITATRLGLPAVDVGSPMLSMHSCREMAGTADVQPMIRVLESYLSGG